MPRTLVKSLVIIYGIAQLALPIGGHDVLDRGHRSHAEPHFHLSALGEVLGIEAREAADYAHFDGDVAFASDETHNSDAVYLPTEVSLIVAKDQFAATERAACIALCGSPVELTFRLTGSDGRVQLLSAAEAPIASRASIQRWQI